MPFTATNLDHLKKFLTAPALDVFIKAANEGLESGLGHNDCIKQGWAATKEAGWSAPSTGKKWVLVNKDDPGPGDVYVQTPAPKKKPKAGDDFESGCAKFLKVDDGLGLVFGFAIVCKENGQDYFDTQDDHVPEQSMLEAASDFMLHSRVAKDMHEGDEVGTIVFAWPLTTDIAKAMGIQTSTTGLMIAMKPPADILAKFRNGDYTGFSIGGRRLVDEEVA